MHIETLKVFCDLVEMQSFSLAAERNFVTQSAVSQQVRSLEEKFKRKLLERVRGRREIRLTAAGDVFYQESKKVLDSFDQLNENMNSLVGRISGVVKIATVYSVGLHELPPIVREFMSKFPSVKIDLEYQRTTRVVRDVLKGIVELGVLAFPETRRGLTLVPMASDRLVLICHPDHELAGRKQLKAKDLKGQDFVLFERDIPTRKATDKLLKSFGVGVNKISEFDNIETIKRAVEVGFGMAIVPYPSVMDEEKNGQLSVVQLKEKDWVRPVGVVYRSDRELSLAAKKFVKLLEKDVS
ncbi:MAG: LysR family transcriptional regulator [Pyrinomonadaceae bacterium]